MKFLSILAPLALVSAAVALPAWNDWNGNCVTQAEADDIVNKFASILAHSNVNAANATAQALIADGFFEKSDSINLLAGFPVC